MIYIIHRSLNNYINHLHSTEEDKVKEAVDEAVRTIEVVVGAKLMGYFNTILVGRKQISCHNVL